MTAIEAFNSLDNREVSRKEVEDVLNRAKEENNTTIIYRLSKILNDYPQATHFDISITHYQPQEGLLGVQHTGNYKEALDDCGRLRKGWKFVNGNVVNVEEKPKKADKPKKEKAPQKETKKDKKYKFVVITDDRPSRVIAVFSYTNPNIKDLRESFWKNGEGKYYETTEEGLRNYTFGMGPYPFADAKKNIEEKYTEGKDFIYFIFEKDGGRDEAISLVEKPKKEKSKAEEKTPAKKELPRDFSEDLDYKSLYNSYSLISFDPERRAENDKKMFGTSMLNLYNSSAEEAKENNRLEEYNQAFERYYAVILKKNKEVISARTGTFSTAVTGGAGIKSSQIRKNEAKQKREYEINKELIDYIEKAEKKLNEVARNPDRFYSDQAIKSTDKNAIEKLNQKIEQLEAEKDFIKRSEKACKEFQKKKDFSVFEKYNIPQKEAKEYVSQIERHGIPLIRGNASINAEIRRVKERIASLEKSKATEDENFDIENGRILVNKEAQRVQIFFDNIPDANTREALKKRSFKWAPSVKAWQRTLTGNAIDAVRYLIKDGVLVKKNSEEVVMSVKSREEKGENEAINIDSSKFKKAKVVQQIGDYVKIFFETGNCYVPKGIFPKKREGFKSSNLKGAFWLDDLEKEGLAPVKKNGEIFFVKTGLNAPRHEGILKEALTEKGKLKKGWYFQDYGIIDPKGKYHPLERDFAYEYKVASDELNSRAFEQNEKRKRKGFEENVKLQENLKGFLKSLSQKYKKYFKSYKAVEIFYWAFNFGERPTKFFTIDETNPYSEIQLKVFDKYFSNKNELFTRLENYETLRRYNLTDLGYNIISEIDSFLNKEGKKVRGDIKKINKKYGLNAPSVPEVSTEMFKHMKVSELRAFTLDYYLNYLKGKKVAIKNHLKEVIFTTKAGRKIAKGEAMYSEKAAVIEHLEELIKNSTYNNWGDRKDSDGKDVLGYLNFKSKITIDGEKRHLRIAISVDNERNLKLKSYDIGKEKSESTRKGVKPSSGQVESLFKAVQSTQEPVATLQDEGIEQLSEGKDTKKSLSRKKKDENFGLNGPEAPEAPETPETSLPASRQTLAQQLATRPEVRESFLVADEQMSLFLGSLEKKTKDSLVITLTGKQGSGKTRFAFQFMNALAQRYQVGHASIEEHPESVLYEEKAYQYLNDTALEHITAQDVRSLEELDTMIRTNEVIVIDSFQKMRELAPNFEVDKDLRKKYDGKLFLVIFQQTADGKMRGGSKSQYDGDIILFTETFPDYRENYVFPDKNRYNKRPATELQYSIYEKRMLATAPEDSSLPDQQEPTEIDELNFDVL